MFSSKILLDFRFCCLGLALLAMAVVFIRPTQTRPAPVYDYIFIVDITRSMNAADYRLDGQAVSRLHFLKHSLRGMLTRLPCQSKVGLGVFTERRPALLFEPVEVCRGFNEIDTALAWLDWRMAWAADSRIAQGLYNTLELTQALDTPVVFFTDGQEAPPLNPRYRPDFSTLKGKVKGMIVGVGGMEPVPIPKFTGRGEPDGFYRAEDVPHRSTFGESDLDPEKIQGHNARNAPFGNAAVVGKEHLSALQEGYLQDLSDQAGLRYHRLTHLDALAEALLTSGFAQFKQSEIDVRWQAAAMALLLLVLAYARGVSNQLKRQLQRRVGHARSRRSKEGNVG